MKKKLLAIMSMALLGAPLYAGAAPIQYDLTYTGTQGPNGTGSLFFDAAVGEITGFTWDFGGIVGGITDGSYGGDDVFGDTRGRFVFEMLSQTDVHTGVDCIVGGCSTQDNLFGNGPFDATTFFISSGGNLGPTYMFETEDGIVAQGNISLNAQPPATTVPEPATGSLIVGSLLALAAARRRKI